MKTILTLFLGLFIILSAFGQNSEKPPEIKKSRKKQNELRNDVYVGYNYGSLYLTNPYVDHSYTDYPDIGNLPEEANSNGALTIGINRMLSRVITMGFMISYEMFTCSGDYHSNGSGTVYKANISDNVFSEISMLTLNYVNRPVIRLYSAVGVGVTVVFSNVKGTSPGAVSETKRQMLPAGQVTLIGLRVGRSLGGFFEIGFGSAAVLSGGISYKFGD